eukprot:scaffold990_cov393-Prasinococcus_capsulatus_cf.AAC.11
MGPTARLVRTLTRLVGSLSLPGEQAARCLFSVQLGHGHTTHRTASVLRERVTWQACCGRTTRGLSWRARWRAVNCASTAGELDAVDKTPTGGKGATGVIALKEWAVTIAALLGGEQILVVRKGGIREPHFDVRGRKFWLLPTSFHEAQNCVQESALATKENRQALAWELDKSAPVKLEAWAECIAAWKTFDNPEDVMMALEPFHVWTPAFTERRLRWREGQALSILLLRTYSLPVPVTIPASPDFWGCFSWADLPEEAALHTDESFPALPDQDFESKTVGAELLTGVHSWITLCVNRMRVSPWPCRKHSSHQLNCSESILKSRTCRQYQRQSRHPMTAPRDRAPGCSTPIVFRL